MYRTFVVEINLDAEVFKERGDGPDAVANVLELFRQRVASGETPDGTVAVYSVAGEKLGQYYVRNTRKKLVE